MRLAAFQAIIYQVTATTNSPIAILACAFIFYTTTRKTQMLLHADLLAHLKKLHTTMCKKNRRI